VQTNYQNYYLPSQNYDQSSVRNTTYYLVRFCFQRGPPVQNQICRSYICFTLEGNAVTAHLHDDGERNVYLNSLYGSAVLCKNNNNIIILHLYCLLNVRALFDATVSHTITEAKLQDGAGTYSSSAVSWSYKAHTEERLME
jgi:hypothetical protein